MCDFIHILQIECAKLRPRPLLLMSTHHMQTWKLNKTTSAILCGGHRIHKTIRTAAMSEILAHRTVVERIYFRRSRSVRKNLALVKTFLVYNIEYHI